MTNKELEDIARAIVDSMGQNMLPWNPANGQGGDVVVESTRQAHYENIITIVKARIEVELK